jgi:hypothetical protein
MGRKTNSLLIVITFAFGIMVASSISTALVVVFAQENQTNTGASSSGNQTAAKQQSGNNSSANPLSKVPIIGNLFGGK